MSISKIYIKKINSHVGVKILGLADSHVFHTYNKKVYCGKQPKGLYQVLNAGLLEEHKLTYNKESIYYVVLILICVTFHLNIIVKYKINLHFLMFH